MNEDIIKFLEHIIEEARTECDYNYYCRLTEILNLIEKQAKEIEELKADNYEANCRIKDLLEEGD